MINKIISGGQRGADQAGLIVARELGIETGGVCPKGWRVRLYDGSEGSDPWLASLGLIEHESVNYPPRTKQNVRDSDATIWIGYIHSPGARLTIGTAKELNKPLAINLKPRALNDWINQHEPRVINIAGNTISPNNPDIYERTYRELYEALSGSPPLEIKYPDLEYDY